MRASELLEARVLTDDGRHVGYVTGLRCSLDGSGAGPVPAPRLRTLVVTSRRVGSALGYQEEQQHGPWLIRWAIRRLHRHTCLIEWDEVDEVGNGAIRLHRGWSAR